tara:strand:+ start:176 stop:436 length:261 start_codon:yes stop_codon:yes gene_type:complete
MEDRPEYIIYYLINRLKFLEQNRPSIFHVYRKKKSLYFVISSEKAAKECRDRGYIVEKADLNKEINKLATEIMSQKLNKFILDSIN